METLTPQQTDALAHEIAKYTAKADIDSFCELVPEACGDRNTRWYNTATPDNEDERFFVDNAVRYLEAVGILERNPQDVNLVRWEHAQ